MNKPYGYQILDFKGIAMTASSGEVVPGIYSGIMNANGKLLICANLNLDGQSYQTPIPATYDGEKLILMNGYTATVTEESQVTFTKG